MLDARNTPFVDTVFLTYSAFGQSSSAILSSLLDTYRSSSMEVDTFKEKEKKKKARQMMANVVLVIKRWLKLDWMLLEDTGIARNRWPYLLVLLFIVISFRGS